MNSARSESPLDAGTATLTQWINRALEFLWLLAVILVPLGFLDREYAGSEAVISYVEVPKIALLRTLVAGMAVLWLMGWAIKARYPSRDLTPGTRFPIRPSTWLPALSGWLNGQPVRWLFLAVGFYLGTTVLSTFLSGSFQVSLWGEVPGQDGYAAYTIAAYVILFGVISTRLETRFQLWRLLGAMVLVGVLVAGYGIFQHYAVDFLNLTEITGGGKGRVTSFMGNTLFAAAVMLMTITITLVMATVTVPEATLPPGKFIRKARSAFWAVSVAGLWASALAVQFLGLTFTFSRGPWIGSVAAIVLFLGLAGALVGWRVSARAILILGLAGTLSLALLHGLGSISIFDLGPWFGIFLAGVGGAGFGVVFYGGRILGRLVVIVGLVVTVASAVVLAPSWLGDSGPSLESDASSNSTQSTAVQAAQQLSSIKSEVLSGNVGGRVTHWKVSWELIKDRPWFEFSDLSLPWLRFLIGYGPDMFRYSYLLESPAEGRELLPLEPDHAHNFFIHQTVEQGLLGLLSSLGLFAALFAASAYQLVRQKGGRSSIHLLVLIGLTAVLGGRFLEMMTGVARVSDLTILWVLLAVFAVLPRVMGDPDPKEPLAAQPPQARQPRRIRIPNQSSVRLYNWGHFLTLALVSVALGVIIVVTWVKGVNYVRAAVAEGNAVTRFRQGDLQGSLVSLDQAISLAPDVSHYYNNRAAVYLAFQINKDGTQEPGCTRQNNLPYDVCLAVKAFESNLEGAARRPFYYRSRLALAGSAYNLPQLEEESIQFYQDSLSLVPASWPIHNELADAYLKAGRPQEAFPILEESLAITKNSPLAADALFLQGLAYFAIDDLTKAVRSWEQSLELGLSGRKEVQARRMLAEPHIVQAKVHTDAGQYDKAILEWDEAIRAEPRTLGHYINRGRVYLLMGKYEQAIAEFFQVAKKDRGHADAYYFSGQGLHAQGNFNGAISNYSDALVQDPEHLPALLSRGTAHNQRGEYRLAIQDFGEVIRLDPEGAAAYSGLAHVLFKMGRFEEAVQESSRAIDLDLDFSVAYIHRANALSELGNYTQALQDFAEAIRLDRDSYDAYVHRGTAYSNLGQDDWAILDFNQAIRVNPEGALAYQGRGNSYSYLGDYGQAVEDLTIAVGLELGDPVALLQRGRARSSLGRHEDAVEDFSKFLSSYPLGDLLAPDRALPYADRGNAYIELGEVQRAVGDLTLAIQLDPTLVSAFKKRGEAYNSLGKFQLAIVDFDQVIRLDAGSASSYAQQSLSYSELGAPKVAIQALDRAVQLEPDNPQLLLSRGEAYNQLGQYSRAIEDLDQAIALDPELATAYSSRGNAYNGVGQYQRAIADFDRATSLDEDLFSSYALKGIALNKLGRYESAIHEFNRAINLDDSVPLPHSQRAFAYGALGQYDQVIQSATQAISLDPEDATAYYARGKALGSLKQFERAIEDLDRAISLNPGIAMSYAYRGDAYTELGDYQRAIENFEAAVNVDSGPAWPYAQLGKAFSEFGEYKQAIQSLDTAIRLDPGLTSAYGNRAAAFIVQGQYENAIQDFSQLIRLEPELTAAYRDRASAYILIGLYENAIQDISQAIRLDPELATDYTDRASAYILAELYENAILDLNEAIRLNPEDTTNYLSLGEAYNGQGQTELAAQGYNRAIRQFNLAIDLDPGDSTAYYFRGKALSGLGQDVQAMLDFGQAIRVDPELALAYSNRDNDYGRLGKFGEILLGLDNAGIIYGKDTTGSRSGRAGGSFSYNGPGFGGHSALYDDTFIPGSHSLFETTHTIYDFGPTDRVHVRRVIIKNGGPNTRGVLSDSIWRLDFSDDNSSWVEVGEFTMEAGQGNAHVHDFPASGPHRFWRLKWVRSGVPGSDVSIEEIAMLELDAG